MSLVCSAGVCFDRQQQQLVSSMCKLLPLLLFWVLQAGMQLALADVGEVPETQAPDRISTPIREMGISMVAPGLRQDWTFPQPLRVCFTSLLDFSGRCNGAPTPEFEARPNSGEGSPPSNGWCSNGEDFCGYDVQVWQCAPASFFPRSAQMLSCIYTLIGKPMYYLLPACCLHAMWVQACRHASRQIYIVCVTSRITANALGLKEGRDYVRVCMGENGFGPMIDDLSEWRNVTNDRRYQAAQWCDLSAQTITVTPERIKKYGIQFSWRTYQGYLAILVHGSLDRCCIVAR